MSLSLVLAGSLSAQDRLVPKQLAGPIDEVRTGVMAKVAPIENAIQAKSAMIPVQLRPEKNGDWRWQGRIAADGETLRLVMFAGDESWDVSLQDAATKSAPVPARSLATSLERSSLDMGDNSYGGDYYEFAEIGAGEWSVEVSASAPAQSRGYLVVGSDSPYRLLSYRASQDQLVGSEIAFVAYGYEKLTERPQEKLSLAIVNEASLRVLTPAGDEKLVAMFDDGLHGDGAAGDGVFGGSFIADMAGEYQAQVMARGLTPAGLPFVRTAQHVVPVIESRTSLMRDFATARVIDENRLEVELAIDGPASKFRAFAEVWGADELGQMQPVSWIGGMVYAENGRVSLGLDARWIGLSKARSGFELRNLRLEDPDTFITVAGAKRLAVAMPKLPVSALRAPKSMDEAMFMGPRPAQAPNKSGPKLLLVHGYCSGNAWGSVAGQFSNYAIFQDLNQNRSHDQFANLIGSFGSAYSSFGIVAHSQGGAASLHLYTYYWSGLDFATGNRLIQSVGTPYQGTALAGNAAVLGQIFGIGCGVNNDLTYSGASSWLSGIPSWARNKVNYYTTSFTDKWWRYDYCQIVTDLLLSDPDDGTTEKAKGQLSSAINRGHKTGWCHTDGMRDPNQVKDSSRNSTMNSNAAR